MKRIDGRTVARTIRNRLARRLARLRRAPSLAIILVGNDPGSKTYVRLKERAAAEAGIEFGLYRFPTTVNEETIIKHIDRLNRRSTIHGIIVQLPLPKHLNEDRVVLAIRPDKDADGFHLDTLKRYLGRKRGAKAPGVIRGILRLVDETGVRLIGKRAVILANSQIFTDPLMDALERRRMRVETFIPPLTGFQRSTKRADLVVVAIGRPKFLKGSMVKRGAILVDVGFNRKNGRVVGDVDERSVTNKAGWLTPVPGGVGPMTVAMLLERVVELAERHSQ